LWLMSRRQQFSIQKSDDRFVADMLRYVSEKYNAQEFAGLKVKVIHYATLDQWLTLLPHVSATYDPRRFEEECGKRLEMNRDNWVRVNCYLLHIVAQDTETGEILPAEESLREETLIENGFDPELADALSQFDALIFVNQHNIVGAFKAGQAFPLHGPLTHECVHIIERRAGQQIIKDFDSDRQYHDDVSWRILMDFIDKIGPDEFVCRYLVKPGESVRCSMNAYFAQIGERREYQGEGA